MIARIVTRFGPNADAVKMRQYTQVSVAVKAHMRSRAQKQTTVASKSGIAQHTIRAGFRDIRRVATSRETHSFASDISSTSSQQGDTCNLSAAAKPTCSQSAAGSLDCSALVDNDLDTRWASEHQPAKVNVVRLLCQRSIAN